MHELKQSEVNQIGAAGLGMVLNWIGRAQAMPAFFDVVYASNGFGYNYYSPTSRL